MSKEVLSPNRIKIGDGKNRVKKEAKRITNLIHSNGTKGAVQVLFELKQVSRGLRGGPRPCEERIYRNPRTKWDSLKCIRTGLGKKKHQNKSVILRK